MLSIVVFVTVGTSQVSALPSPINYQGVLADEHGQPLNGTYSITFTVYDAATGGSELWTETHNSVNVNDAVVDVQLGGVGASRNL